MKIVTRLLLLAGAFFLSIGTAPSFASCDPYPTLDRFKGTLPHVPGAVSFLLDTEHTLVFLAAYNATPPLTSATADAVFIHGIPTAPKALFAVVSDGCVMGYELAPVWLATKRGWKQRTPWPGCRQRKTLAQPHFSPSTSIKRSVGWPGPMAYLKKCCKTKPWCSRMDRVVDYLRVVLI